ncbi:MAG: hypothetical protein ACKVXR_03920 [Planctomycetota bacterium]
MGKKKTKTNTTTNESTTGTPIETQVEAATQQAVATTEEPAPETEAPKKGKRKKSVSGVATLIDLASAYATQMEEDGKSDGTIASYKMELKTAMTELGEETPLADLTPEKVGAFFTSKRVMKLRSGKNKSQLSIDKTRRVLRLALVWAEERGIVAKAPLPETEPAKR